MSAQAKRSIALVLVGLLVLAVGCRKHPPAAPPGVTINGHTWTVEIAMTKKQRYNGLSGRAYLPTGTGMLFIYPKAQPLRFWMQGCLIPLDIAFIGEDLRVLGMYTMAVEDDLGPRTIYPSPKPAQFALEIPAGSLEKAGVKTGDKVIFSDEIPDPAKAQGDP